MTDRSCSDNAGKAFWPDFWRIAAVMLAGVKRGLATRRAYRRLQAMPDSMLKDIGISRCGIDDATAQGRHETRYVRAWPRDAD